MKKFIILIFSCLLLTSCYNRQYCEELIKQYDDITFEINYIIESDAYGNLRYGALYSRDCEKILTEMLKTEQRQIKLELIRQRCPKKFIKEKERYGYEIF